MSRDGYLPPGVEHSDPNFNENPGCSRCEFSCGDWDDDRLTLLRTEELVCENCLSEDDERPEAGRFFCAPCNVHFDSPFVTPLCPKCGDYKVLEACRNEGP